MSPNNTHKALALTLGLSALLTVSAAHAQPYHLRQSVIIGGSDCRVTHSWEDGSAIAHCRNHTVWTYDADGNALYGVAPGTWIKQKQTRKGPYGR